jgi:hypothetical protein
MWIQATAFSSAKEGGKAERILLSLYKANRIWESEDSIYPPPGHTRADTANITCIYYIEGEEHFYILGHHQARIAAGLKAGLSFMELQ